MAIQRTEVDILRVQDGKLREHWGVTDAEKMLAQLRMSPPESVPGDTGVPPDALSGHQAGS